MRSSCLASQRHIWMRVRDEGTVFPMALQYGGGCCKCGGGQRAGVTKLLYRETLGWVQSSAGRRSIRGSNPFSWQGFGPNSFKGAIWVCALRTTCGC